MRGLASAASIVLLFSAAPVMAQTAAPAQQPTQPAQAAAPTPAPQPPAPFPQGAKIGYVDFQRVANESAEGKISTKRIQDLITRKQNEGAEKNKAMQANQQKLEQQGGVMSEAVRGQLQKEIERQQVEAQRFQQDAQAEVQELQNELQNDFQRKVLPLLQQVAEERGLQLLLSRSDAGIIWAEPGLDLTNDVVKKLDALAAGAKSSSAQKP